MTLSKLVGHSLTMEDQLTILTLGTKIPGLLANSLQKQSMEGDAGRHSTSHQEP